MKSNSLKRNLRKIKLQSGPHIHKFRVIQFCKGFLLDEDIPLQNLFIFLKQKELFNLLNIQYCTGLFHEEKMFHLIEIDLC